MLRKSAIVASLIVSLLTFPAQGYAEDPANGAETLSYQQALDMAYANSYKLKTAEANIDRADEVYDEVSDNVRFTQSGPAANDSEAMGADLTKSIVKADIAYEMSKKQLEITKDALAYSVKKAYNSVLQAQQKKNIAELTLKDALWKSRIANAKYRVGAASEFEYNQAMNTYTAEKTNLEAATKALEDAYKALNQLIGVASEKRMQLTDSPEMVPMDDINLETYVNQVTSSSIPIWMAEKNVELAKTDLDLYVFNTGSSEPYEAKEIDLKKAQYSLGDKKLDLAQSVRSLYYGIRQLEDQYKALQANLAKAEDSLKVTKVRFDIGMATEADVVAAELSVANLKKQIFDVMVQHEQNVFAFEKPWAVSGG